MTETAQPPDVGEDGAAISTGSKDSLEEEDSVEYKIGFEGERGVRYRGSHKHVNLTDEIKTNEGPGSVPLFPLLKGLFWADEDAKRNYFTFGDVVSFDATYHSNRYGLIFVPFTGIDNHHRNVTLGAALIGSGTADSYRWLLNVFKKAFTCEPQVVVTDQDPAVKRAVQDSLPNSRHRLCMGHVMDKLTGKVGSNLCNKTDFKKRLSNIVWTDSITPDDFEREWKNIMTDFQLTDHEWLCSIYELRRIWILAYYLHENMSGLMLTSSWSESENHFFGKFCNPRCTLVEFLSHFDTAMEAQRYEQHKSDHVTRYTTPYTWTDYVLEKQAAQIYTRTIFLDVQLEIDSSIRKCVSFVSTPVNDFRKYEIRDFEQPCSTMFQVMFRKEDLIVSCSCLRFEQFGLLCRHIFYVLRFCDVLEFPKQYILRRWTREAIPNVYARPMVGIDGRPDSDFEVDAVVREIMFSSEHVVNRLVKDMDQLCLFRDNIKQYMTKVDESQVVRPEASRKDRFATYAGSTQPSHAVVRVPIGTRFKGCGSGKRLKSKREQAISQSGKKPRWCHKCQEVGHDSRNCIPPNPAPNNPDGASTSGVNDHQQ